MPAGNMPGAGWMANLALSPKKHQAYEDKLGAEGATNVNHRLAGIGRNMSPLAREIPDSDSDAFDNDDDDDDELPSLDAILGTRNPSAREAASRPAKKTFGSGAGLSSDGPSPEKGLADFLAIIKDAEEADELDRIQDSAASETGDSPSSNRSHKLDGRALYEQAVNIVQDQAGEDDSEQEQHIAKLRQAMERQAAAYTAPYYYFFAPANDSILASGTLARMSLGSLAPAVNTREISLAVQSKLATKYLYDPGINLSDELLDWILNVYPTERSEAVRAEYLQILSERSVQVGRLINEKQLKQWFVSIGADNDAISLGEKGKCVGPREPSKVSRDWTPFYNILELLRHCCNLLPVDILIHAVIILLRASIDSELRLQASLATALNDTIVTLIANVRDDREKFCRKVCNLFVQTVDSASLLSRAVEATHHAEVRLSNTGEPPEEFMPFKDLRTRLQLSVFFKDAEQATPERCGTALTLLRSILQRLDDPDFKGRVGGRGDLNYYDLNGYGLALTEIIPFLHYLRQLTTDKAEQSEFDRSIDDLRRQIGFVTSMIQIIGPMDDFDARYEAKTRWQALDYRLSHFFPRRGGRGVFSSGDITEAEAEGEKRRVEKQQNFMANFLRKAKSSSAV